MPPATQPTSNTKMKRRLVKCGTVSLPTQKPWDSVNCIGTHTASTARATAAVEVKARQASKSIRQTTTLVRIKATQTGCTLKLQRCQQRHLRPHGEPCQNHKSHGKITLSALDLGTLCVSLIGSQVESATSTLVCVTTTEHNSEGKPL